MVVGHWQHSETWVNITIYRIQDRNITVCRYKVTSQVVRVFRGQVGSSVTRI